MILHPDWVLKFREKGTEIRVLKGNYYLYKITSKWNPEKKRPQKITERFLGTIKPEGLIPSKTDQLREKHKSVSVKEFGASYFIYNQNLDILQVLQELFPESWKEIFVGAYCKVVHNAPVRSFDFFYQTSFLSEMMPLALVDDINMLKLFENLSLKNKQITDFFTRFSMPDDYVIVDNHILTSEFNPLKQDKKGINYFPVLFFSPEKMMPVAYNLAFRNDEIGSAIGKSIAGNGFQNIILLTKLFDNQLINTLNCNLYYIKRVNASVDNIDYSKFTNTVINDRFVYNNTEIICIGYISDNQQFLLFAEPSVIKELENSDFSKIEYLISNYSIDNQFTIEPLLLTTNLKNISTEKIYTYYLAQYELKGLIQILKESFNADKSFLDDKNKMYGWMLINFVASLLYFRTTSLLRSKDLYNKYSANDILGFLLQIKKLKIDNIWYLSDSHTKYKEIADTLGLTFR